MAPYSFGNAKASSVLSGETRIETGMIVNVNPVNKTVDWAAHYTGRLLTGIQLGSPYFHYDNGEGFTVVPDLGAMSTRSTRRWIGLRITQGACSPESSWARRTSTTTTEKASRLCQIWGRYVPCAGQQMEKPPSYSASSLLRNQVCPLPQAHLRLRTSRYQAATMQGVLC